MSRRLFIVIYTLSGAAALVYQVAWTRLLTLHLGHTVAAASTVLAAFMGGLALGAWIAGRFAARMPQSKRLTAYAGLEVLVAVIAIALPVLLSLATPLLTWAYADATSPARFAATRVIVGLALLGLPAAAMGATFPLAAAWFARSNNGAGGVADVGVLYASNTAGAALGALAAGFWIIPSAGLRGATWVGVALNILAALGAFWLLRQEDATTPVAEAEPPPPARKKRAPRSVTTEAAAEPMVFAGCAATAVSGFSALVYEVVWTRLIAVTMGPTTYAFATMATVFIGGLAIGSAAGTRIVRRAGRPVGWLAGAMMFGAAASVVSAWFTASRLPAIVGAAVGDPATSFNALLWQQGVLVGLLLLPMTIALGATFPLALAVASGGPETMARDTARVYVSNTVGAIFGALAAGFVLIPRFGLRTTLLIVALTSVVTGAVSLWVASRARAGTLGRLVVMTTGAVAIVLLTPQWDRSSLSSGSYLYASQMPAEVLEVLVHSAELEYYQEGAAGTVTVRRLADGLSMAVDGKVDASTGSDMPTQRLLGLLPVMLHPAPEDVNVIGLGSGVTLASALAPGRVQRADVVEISPEVVEASALFDAESKQVLKDPRVRLIVGDGRSHLALTPRRYDVIVSQPSNPWMAGIAALFTKEYFESVRARLKPGGIFCQWAHTYDIGSDDLRSIVRTFSSVFPETTMWIVGEADVLLLGSVDPILATPDVLARNLSTSAARQAFSDLGIPASAAPFALLSLFAGGPAELERYAAGGSIQTDDRMALEFSAPRNALGSRSNQNASDVLAIATAAVRPPAVQQAYDQVSDEGWVARGRMALEAKAYKLAFDAFERAVAINSHNDEAVSGWPKAAAAIQRLDDVKVWLEARAQAEPGNVAVLVELSRMLVAMGQSDRAATVAEAAMRNAPGDPRGGTQLAIVFEGSNDVGRLGAVVDELTLKFPGSPDVQYHRAELLLRRGDAQAAVEQARRAVAAAPGHQRANRLLGAACLSLGELDCARSALEAARIADPRDAPTHVFLGDLALRSNDPAAIRYFAQALTLDRRSAAAARGYAMARAKLLAK